MDNDTNFEDLVRTIDVKYIIDKLLEAQVDIDNIFKEAKSENDANTTYKYDFECDYVRPSNSGRFELCLKIYHDLDSNYDISEEWTASATVKMLDILGNLIDVECVKVRQHSIKSICTVAIGILLKQLVTKGV